MSRRKLIAALAVVLCLPVATVAWLAARLLEQDHALEQQRLAERRDQAADRAIQSLSLLLANLPPSPRLFRRAVPPQPQEDFASVEALEFQPATLPQAIARYRSLAPAPGALLRLGRSLAKAGQTDEALSVYARLARLDSAIVAGWPAPVAALWSRCNLLESQRQSGSLVAEALHLQEILNSGRYPLDHPSYTVFAVDAARWTGRPRPTAAERRTAAILQVEARTDRPPVGNAVIDVEGEPLTVVWTPTSIAAATSSDLAAALPPATWLRTPNGQFIGTPGPGTPSVRYPAETRLPWTLFAQVNPQPEAVMARRRLLFALLAAVALFTLAGAWFAIRLLQKELALARMQQDFVAAVSHEFRTPLTTLRQLTESLEDNRIPTEDRRQSAYKSLSRATHRLHRLVEDLLDFRRMQSGALEYRLVPLNTRDFTIRLAADFQHEIEPRGFRLNMDPGPEARIHADPEALSRALWNLLDNAVKYSGDSRTIDFFATTGTHSVQWSVRDRGIGIPASERPLVFQQFFRGHAARRAGIRGTGIGLAMVEQIVTAHGGKLAVQSEEGAGSVFTLSLPSEQPLCKES